MLSFYSDSEELHINVKTKIPLTAVISQSTYTILIAWNSLFDFERGSLGNGKMFT